MTMANCKTQKKFASFIDVQSLIKKIKIFIIFKMLSFVVLV